MYTWQTGKNSNQFVFFSVSFLLCLPFNFAYLFVFCCITFLFTWFVRSFADSICFAHFARLFSAYSFIRFVFCFFVFHSKWDKQIRMLATGHRYFPVVRNEMALLIVRSLVWLWWCFCHRRHLQHFNFTSLLYSLLVYAVYCARNEKLASL